MTPVFLPTQPVASAAPVEDENTIFRMPPKATYALDVTIGSVQRGRPASFVVPDWMLEEEAALAAQFRSLLIAARVGVVENKGSRYALTWWE